MTACESSTAALVVLAVGAAEIDSRALAVPVPNIDGASIPSWPVPPAVFWNGSSWAWVARAEPVNVGTLLVPAGVPALTRDVLMLLVPVKTGTATVPAGVPADVPVDVAALPVNAGAEFVPAGVPTETRDVF